MTSFCTIEDAWGIKSTPLPIKASNSEDMYYLYPKRETKENIIENNVIEKKLEYPDITQFDHYHQYDKIKREQNKQLSLSGQDRYTKNVNKTLRRKENNRRRRLSRLSKLSNQSRKSNQSNQSNKSNKSMRSSKSVKSSRTTESFKSNRTNKIKRLRKNMNIGTIENFIVDKIVEIKKMGDKTILYILIGAFAIIVIDYFTKLGNKMALKKISKGFIKDI